jgi:predicted phage baseplate assembly protein
MARACGCTANTCWCCEGTRILTPAAIDNRPGLPAIAFRVGTYGTFFETMKARLASMTVVAPGPDGQTLQTYRPLQTLTTRDSSDFSIALLGGWSAVADALTFYQERIANEGYLRTATERRSVLELSRLIGYTLRPGVAATVYLAYTLDDNQAQPVVIPAGSRSQSIPVQGSGELPQSFETSDDLTARTAWNNLQVRRSQPQNITFDNVLTIDRVFVSGTSTNLKAGDSLLFTFGDQGEPALRTVVTAEGDFNYGRTEIHLLPVPAPIVAVLPALRDFVTTARRFLTGPDPQGAQRLLNVAKALLTNTYLGVPSDPATWAITIRRRADVVDSSELGQFIAAFGKEVDGILGVTPPPPTPSGPITDPSRFVDQLLIPPVVQPRSGLQLNRSLTRAFQSGADLQPQLLLDFAPRLRGSFYTAWANAAVNSTPPALEGLIAFRVEAPLFGAGVPRMASYDDKTGRLNPPDLWTEWDLAGDERTDSLFLDQAYDEVLPGSYALIQQTADGLTRQLKTVTAAQTVQRTAYGTSSKTTQLAFADDWRGDEVDLSYLRAVLVYAQSEPLSLADEPITADVQGQEVTLDQLYDGLTSGRWVIFSGERADIPGVTGVTASELLMVSGLRQDFNASLPGDTTHTTLLLGTPTAYSYKRDTLVIYGNVVKATHGETRNETLGSGDGSQALQSFTLKQPPLTYVPAPVPSGIQSTLKVYVNNVQWHEVDTLAGLGPKDRNFITQTDDNAVPTVIFGDGRQGSRLPTGTLNVTAVYRNGIGRPGNVLAGQISMIQTKPLGVKAVVNPLDATGGADKETLDQARGNAPIAVMALDRVVSVEDYANFARTFAGIAKAEAVRLSDGHRQLVYLTIAAAADIPIDPTSDLYLDLVAALQDLGDPDLIIQVDLRERMALVLSARVRLDPDYLWDPVAMQIRATLLDAFGFDRRALGQPALLCEIISAIQNVDGVVYVDVDAFGGVPEKTVDRQGARLLTLPEITKAVRAITGSGFDLQLMSWGDGSNVPTSGHGLVIVGTDAAGLLHIRSFDAAGVRTDTSEAMEGSELHLVSADASGNVLSNTPESSLTAAKSQAIATLKQQLPGLLPPHVLSGSEKDQVLSEATSITGRTPGSQQTSRRGRAWPSQRVDAQHGRLEAGILRPAQLAIFTPAVPDTLILNQIS